MSYLDRLKKRRPGSKEGSRPTSAVSRISRGSKGSKGKGKGKGKGKASKSKTPTTKTPRSKGTMARPSAAEMARLRKTEKKYAELKAMLLRDLKAQVVMDDILGWIVDPTAPLPSGVGKASEIARHVHRPSCSPPNR